LRLLIRELCPCPEVIIETEGVSETFDLDLPLTDID
jgi:hypothetical protein